MTKLSDTQSLMLSQASQHEALLAVAPANLPAAARQAVFRSMLKNLLLEEVPAPAEHRDLAVRQDEDGAWVALRITADGLRAIGIEPEAPSNIGTEPRALTPDEEAAELKLQQEALDAENAAEAALAGRAPARMPGAPHKPREGTKQEAVLTLLRRDEGTNIADVMEATGWAQHTVRGFFAGLKKKGHIIEVLERVKQVGAGKQGAKGSYSIYRATSRAVIG